MEFTKTQDEWYPHGFWVSDSGKFSIGFTKELFNRKKVQVMHTAFNNWWVIREYVTYEDILLDSLLLKIQKSLKMLPESVSEWKDVEDLLPKFNVKYLEDEGNEKFHKESNWTKKSLSSEEKWEKNNGGSYPQVRSAYGIKNYKHKVDNFTGV